MDTDSDEEPAQHDKVAVDHTRDLVSETIPAREAGIGTAEAAGRRTLRAKPAAPKVQNEYARPYKTTAAARRERRPNIISLMKWKLKRASVPRQAGPEMFDIWGSFQHP